MAEAVVNDRFGNEWKAFNAGTQPAGYVHPKALKVLREASVHHAATSKHVDEVRSIPFDLVVTVCDSAAEECPLWLGPGRKVHQSFPEPAKATDSEAEVLAAFRQVRDDILEKIPPILNRRD